jgi:hypothetical protein
MISGWLQRRWLAGLFLLSALLMLILGLTVLAPRLKDYDFVFYWLICLALTGSAAMVALLDLRAISRDARDAQRELIEDILREIEQDRKERS